MQLPDPFRYPAYSNFPSTCRHEAYCNPSDPWQLHCPVQEPPNWDCSSTAVLWHPLSYLRTEDPASQSFGRAATLLCQHTVLARHSSCCPPLHLSCFKCFGVQPTLVRDQSQPVLLQFPPLLSPPPPTANTKNTSAAAAVATKPPPLQLLSSSCLRPATTFPFPLNQQPQLRRERGLPVLKRLPLIGQAACDILYSNTTTVVRDKGQRPQSTAAPFADLY